MASPSSSSPAALERALARRERRRQRAAAAAEGNEAEEMAKGPELLVPGDANHRDALTTQEEQQQYQTRTAHQTGV